MEKENCVLTRNLWSGNKGEWTKWFLVAIMKQTLYLQAGSSHPEWEYWIGKGFMVVRDLKIGMIFSLQNILSFSHYIFFYFNSCTVWYTDVILRHLTIANFLVIVNKGLTQSMAAWGLKHFLCDVGCKLIFFLQCL
jgi:hypothetical protein